jgi:hypothetical protein
MLYIVVYENTPKMFNFIPRDDTLETRARLAFDHGLPANQFWLENRIDLRLPFGHTFHEFIMFLKSMKENHWEQTCFILLNKCISGIYFDEN